VEHAARFALGFIIPFDRPPNNHCAAAALAVQFLTILKRQLGRRSHSPQANQRSIASHINLTPDGERQDVDTSNAFIGKTTTPTPEEVTTALAETNEIWKMLLEWFAEQGVAEQEWKSFSIKYGWSLRLKLKKRTIVHLSPCSGCFRAAFILGDKAVAAARKSDLARDVIKLLDEATRYAEGTGIRLVVKQKKDLAAIRKLAEIKLAN